MAAAEALAASRWLATDWALSSSLCLRDGRGCLWGAEGSASPTPEARGGGAGPACRSSPSRAGSCRGIGHGGVGAHGGSWHLPGASRKGGLLVRGQQPVGQKIGAASGQPPRQSAVPPTLAGLRDLGSPSLHLPREGALLAPLATCCHPIPSSPPLAASHLLQSTVEPRRRVGMEASPRRAVVSRMGPEGAPGTHMEGLGSKPWTEAGHLGGDP